MTDKNMDPEALKTLITAIEEFQQSLAENLIQLNSATLECQDAMGSGLIIQTYLSKMAEGFNALQATQRKAAEITAAMQQDLNRARSVIEGIR